MRFEWLVPGMRKEKVHLLLKSLPQKIRRHCVPLPDYASGFADRWFERAVNPDQGLLEAIGADMWEQVKVRPKRSDFKPETLLAHLFMNFKVVDAHGRMLSGGSNQLGSGSCRARVWQDGERWGDAVCKKTNNTDTHTTGSKS